MTDPEFTVSVVIPTLGRASLHRAVSSALTQTHPPTEVLVVADNDAKLELPADERVVVVPAGPGTGAARCRQIGIDKAQGNVVALLDDDDAWDVDKLRRQFSACADKGESWISSTRLVARGPGGRRRVWPRRLIEPTQPVADYLYRRREFRSGGALLQTSTLCFPTGLGRLVRWDTDVGVHDEAGWLLRAQHEIPGMQLFHVPDVLAEYCVESVSMSRSPIDRTDAYVQWGLTRLSKESSRVRGDYLCSSPVSAAVSAASIRGVVTAIAAALRHGRPGGYALGYAVASLLRVLLRRAQLGFGPSL